MTVNTHDKPTDIAKARSAARIRNAAQESVADQKTGINTGRSPFQAILAQSECEPRNRTNMQGRSATAAID